MRTPTYTVALCFEGESIKPFERRLHHPTTRLHHTSIFIVRFTHLRGFETRHCPQLARHFVCWDILTADC